MMKRKAEKNEKTHSLEVSIISEGAILGLQEILDCEQKLSEIREQN